LLDLDPAAEGGVRWVPYLEQGQPDTPQQAQPAPQSDFPSPEGVAASPRLSTQSLLKRARAMMARRTTEQSE
jgi:hypothetical protein